MAFGFFKNPMTRKRFRRFRAMRRAYVSLWILAVFYGASLFAELICNNEPLYVRYNGASYFPVLRYYADNVFTGSGRKTRPDYRKLQESQDFSENAANFMVFPPIPFSPLESIPPQDIAVDGNVRISLVPVPRIGTVDITRDFRIVRSSGLSTVVSGLEEGIPSRASLETWFRLPTSLKVAVSQRFADQGAPYGEFIIKGPRGENMKASLFTYRPRGAPPETIRLMITEIIGDHDSASAVQVEKDQPLRLPAHGVWETISETDRRILEDLARTRFTRPVDDHPVTAGGRRYTASFLKEDVRFPFPPVKDHPLGIDAAGRDVLARIIYGFRISVSFGLLLVVSSMILGISAGAVQGFYAGKLDITAQRFIEIWSALPFLYVMILMGAVYGRSFTLLLVCYAMFNWVGISYYIRAEFLNLRKRPFVEAAWCMGVPSYKIIYNHILPNALVPVITFFPFFLVGAIGSLAALDYLGFGLPPPTPSWGELLFQAQQYRWAWWLILYPSLALFGVMLLGVFVGEGIRNAYDPKQYSRLE